MKEKKNEKIPPEPFTTSNLQQQVNNNFGYSIRELRNIKIPELIDKST